MLKIYENPELGQIRVVTLENKPWFVGIDVAKILEYTNPQKAIRDHVDQDDRTNSSVIDKLGRSQETTIINESGLYSLILSSKLPSAKKFKHWVTSEVLPSIRKFGLYATEDLLKDPDLLIQMATELKKSREQIKALEESNDLKDQQISEMSPKASYYDVILNCKDAVATSVIAKDFGKSAMWLNKFLEEQGVQYFLRGQKIWLLKAKYQGLGYTQTKTQSFNGKDGDIHSSVHTYWTQKGRLFIYNLLKSLGYTPLIDR